MSEVGCLKLHPETNNTPPLANTNPNIEGYVQRLTSTLAPTLLRFRRCQVLRRRADDFKQLPGETERTWRGQQSMAGTWAGHADW